MPRFSPYVLKAPGSGTWMVQREDRATLDLGVMTLSLTLEVEIT